MRTHITLPLWSRRPHLAPGPRRGIDLAYHHSARSHGYADDEHLTDRHVHPGQATAEVTAEVHRLVGLAVNV